MKKVFAVLLAAVALVCLLAGCSAQNDGDRLAAIKKRGTIIIAMEGDWSPWTYHDESDELVGFDTEVGKAIAAKLGVEAQFEEGNWEGLMPGLDSGRYDLVINGVDITDDRSAKYDFTDAYAFMRTALIVKSDNDSIQSFEDLKGKKTVNSIGSTYMELAEHYGATVDGVPTLEETLRMVLDGRAEATLNAELSFYDYMGVHPESELKVVALTEDASLVAIPMKKGAESDSLREAINQAIAELREEGVLAELSMKYFGTDITKK